MATPHDYIVLEDPYENWKQFVVDCCKERRVGRVSVLRDGIVPDGVFDQKRSETRGVVANLVRGRDAAPALPCAVYGRRSYRLLVFVVVGNFMQVPRTLRATTPPPRTFRSHSGRYPVEVANPWE